MGAYLSQITYMIYKNKKKYLITALFIFSVFLFGNFCFAGILPSDTAKEAATQAAKVGVPGGFNTGLDIFGIIQIIIKVLLGLLGIIFLILIIFAGYNWMTAAGEEEKVKKATDTIKRAVIGLIIIVCAYLITIFVFNKLPN